MNTLQTLIQHLTQNHLTISTAESCTGGNIAHLITLTPGSSAYYKGSIITYCNELKIKLLNVSPQTIQQHTEVSQQVALQMAQGAQQTLNTDIAIATTGIAGPTGALPGKPVGTVYIAAATPTRAIAQRHNYIGTRDTIITQATQTALQLALQLLTTQNPVG